MGGGELACGTALELQGGVVGDVSVGGENLGGGVLFFLVWRLPFKVSRARFECNELGFSHGMHIRVCFVPRAATFDSTQD